MDKQARWIWYPGDWECMLGKAVYSRRIERSAYVSPIWRIETVWPAIQLKKAFRAEFAETLQLRAQGICSIQLDGRYVEHPEAGIQIEAGEHELIANLFDEALPALWLSGESVRTGEDWLASCLDGRWVQAGSGLFSDPQTPPSTDIFEYTEILPVESKSVDRGMLFDFGKELMAKVCLEAQPGTVFVSYGESELEALDTARSETVEALRVGEAPFTAGTARAFRYLYLLPEEGQTLRSVRALYERLPIGNRASFRCDEERFQRIYDTSVYTLELNTREFFFDGIKRDRWVWSGDASQSYLCAYYGHFDMESVKRTMRLLRGKDPVPRHINTIQDYTLYWFISLEAYYQYTGDVAFLREIYPQAVKLMDFVMETVDERGFFNARPNDWVFIDWAPIDNTGDLSFMQLLFVVALRALSTVAGVCGDTDSARAYGARSEALMHTVLDVFWSERYGCFTHGVASAENAIVTKYANMFAVLYGCLDAEKTAQAAQNALLNPDVLAITTPYMRFYELAAMAQLGRLEDVTAFLDAYWGGMLDLGATTIWEEYKPYESGVEHYAMYGRPYGRSLCHAWGAGPIYLFGRYYLGVQPSAPGYAEFTVEPQLGGLPNVEGTVPTPQGTISVAYDGNHLTIDNRTPNPGKAIAFGKTVPIPAQTQCIVNRCE